LSGYYYKFKIVGAVPVRPPKKISTPDKLRRVKSLTRQLTPRKISLNPRIKEENGDPANEGAKEPEQPDNMAVAPAVVKEEEDDDNERRSGKMNLRKRKRVNYNLTNIWKSVSSGNLDQQQDKAGTAAPAAKKRKLSTSGPNADLNPLEAVKEERLRKAKPTIVLYDNTCLEHRVPSWHLERPARLKTVIEAINMIKKKRPNYLRVVDNITPATPTQLSLVHSANYLEKLKELDNKINSGVEQDSIMHATQFSETNSRDSDDKDTYISKNSYTAAMKAAGAVCQAVDLLKVAGRKYQNVFCAVRPPGHHAGRDGHTEEACSQGYCLVNNVAVGAAYALQIGFPFQKVCIIDFDVHHGNGTNEIFRDNNNVLFISIHAKDIYPNTKETDDGAYPNEVNVSLNKGAASEDIKKAFTDHLIPKIHAFKPNLFFISAGFDAHKKDPTKALHFSIRDYSWMTKMIMVLAKKYAYGRVISVLEGGYCLKYLKLCVMAHVMELMKKDKATT